MIILESNPITDNSFDDPGYLLTGTSEDLTADSVFEVVNLKDS